MFVSHLLSCLVLIFSSICLAVLLAEELVVEAPIPELLDVPLVPHDDVGAHGVASLDRVPANGAPLTACGSDRKYMLFVGSTLDWVDAELEVLSH